MNHFSKTELIRRLREISQRGWITSSRGRNDGALGNTLEDLLGIEENNLPIPNANEWELKTKRIGTTSLTTLAHPEPSPRGLHIVPHCLLPNYGWPHQHAGTKYPASELSFRATLTHNQRTDRGFCFKVDRNTRRLVVSFDSLVVDSRHSTWRHTVASRTGLGELDPQPYWGFDDLAAVLRVKLCNAFYVEAAHRRLDTIEQFWFRRVTILTSFSFNSFLNLAEQGAVKIDFDARTGHNHGTKFRISSLYFTSLYESTELALNS